MRDAGDAGCCSIGLCLRGVEDVLTVQPAAVRHQRRPDSRPTRVCCRTGARGLGCSASAAATLNTQPAPCSTCRTGACTSAVDVLTQHWVGFSVLLRMRLRPLPMDVLSKHRIRFTICGCCHTAHRILTQVTCGRSARCGYADYKCCLCCHTVFLLHTAASSSWLWMRQASTRQAPEAVCAATGRPRGCMQQGSRLAWLTDP